jgi:2-polyprenyl-6-hydroxyphenyl methylase/3-demethylubiquinone-9 3-methyltransferase
MRQAIKNAAGLVGPKGYFIVALYNRHWSSKAWLAVKWTYVSCPRWVRRALVSVFYPVIYGAKWLVTMRSPGRQQRGMDFYYNVVDWVGGYPYEYASIREVQVMVEPLGFAMEKAIPAEVPTGCNQFIFRRHPQEQRAAGPSDRQAST